MEEAIQRGLKKLEEMGYLKWNEHYNPERAFMYILAEIEKMTFREMKSYLDQQ